MAEKKAFDEAELESLFAAARNTGPQPGADLIARILVDADSQIAAPVAPVADRKGLVAAVLATIGGWPAAAGLATAAVTGLTIGLVTPDTLDTLSGGYLASASGVYQLEDLLPSYGDLLGEG